MADEVLSKWLSPHHLRTLLLEPEKSKTTCVQIARFVAAYYLDYLLFIPEDAATSLPSLYLWGNLKEEDLSPSDIVLDRTKVSAMLPVEFSPALPALLMVKCDCLIEAISYVDHFDDRRTSLILRLLADSLHEKDLTTDYIKSMIVETLPLQMEECSKNGSISKFSQSFTESILQLDVSMQNELVVFLEQHLVSYVEFVYSELPLESEEVLPNPVYESPGRADSEEAKSFEEIFGHVQILLDSFARSNRIVDQLNYTVKLVSSETVPARISANYTLHRVLLLMLRITYRHLFSTALRENDKKTSKLAERYKQLLCDNDGEHILLQKWFKGAEEEEMERVQSFIDWIQNNYHQNSSLPPLAPTTRELWLRRIVLNSTTNHRDIRQERTIDWFRSVCHPKHRVCDVVMSQMLFINSQWTSPGFTFIQPGCLALRLSIHPHDLCLGTTSPSVNFSASARDILYSPMKELTHAKPDEERLFTPREPSSPDLISKYARKHLEAQTARMFSPFEEQMRVFSRQQDELQMELKRERDFLDGVASTSSRSEATEAPKNIADEALARQLNLLNEKLDAVVKGLAERNNRSMYIREDDEASEISDLPLHYDEAPVSKDTPTIEKLDFGMLSSRTPVPGSVHSITDLSTAKSLTNPLFFAENPNHNTIPHSWMKLLPLEPGSERFADNLLTYNETTPRAEQVTARKVVSDRGMQTTMSNSQRQETQTDSGFIDDREKTKKMVDLKSIRKMSQEDIRMVLDRVSK